MRTCTSARVQNLRPALCRRAPISSNNMKTKYKPLFLILTAFSAASGASLTGTVGDPKGQPVPGSTITLFSSTGGAVAATTSDKTGTYRFERLSAGRYLLLVEAPGFAP